MSFVKLTGEQGQDVWVKPVWVHSVEQVERDVWCAEPPAVKMRTHQFSVLQMVGGGERIILGSAALIVSKLYPQTNPKRTKVRRVGAE